MCDKTEHILCDKHLGDRSRSNYQECLVPNGRVDPGNDIKVRIQKYGASQVQVFVTTPDVSSPFAVAQVGMNHNNVYYGDFGIEGTVSAPDEYSSIPISKFTGMKIKQGSTWRDIPASAVVYVPDTGHGYMGRECPGSSFVAEA